jgi:hypothetical protein
VFSTRTGVWRKELARSLPRMDHVQQLLLHPELSREADVHPPLIRRSAPRGPSAEVRELIDEIAKIEPRPFVLNLDHLPNLTDGS